MRRAWVLRLGAAAGATLAVLAAAGALFLLKPEAVITDRTAAAAIRFLGEAYAPRWSSLRVSARASGGGLHRYALRAEGLCVDDPRGAFSACFSELELAAAVRYSPRGPRLERVERLVAVSADARLDLRAPRAPASPGGLSAAALATPVDALRVELSSFTVATASASVSGSLRAALTSGARRPLALGADVRIKDAAGSRRLKAELTAETDLLDGGGGTYVDLVGTADLGAAGRARAAFRARREPARYAVSGSAELAGLTGPLSGMRLVACEGVLPLAPGEERPSGVDLSCRYGLVLAQALPVSLGSLKTVTGRVTVKARAGDGRYEAELAAKLDPVKVWYELAGEAAVRLAGRRDRPLKEAAASHEVSASLKIPRFQDLVARLRGTTHAIPAPVHVLEGPLSLAVESRGDPFSARPSASYVLSTDLAGARQRLLARAAGTVTAADALSPARAFEHEGELILEEAAFELPRLDVGRAPKVFSDKRIRTAPPPPSAAAPVAAKTPAGAGVPPVRGRLAVKTGKPLILFSNLAKDPVPIALDLALTYPPAAAAGRVEVRSFGVELFRRRATVDHLNIAVSSGASPAALEGLVRYATPSAEIRILLLGTTAKPRIEFTSVPPMKREAVIALLIFGKGPGELDSEQTASVSNTETALESRAFGLASLYLFGATPIEHVGYDPASKTTTVKLRLPGGANLTLGSDFDQSRQLTLRKPLAPHWAIQSEVTDQGREGTGAATFLEWFNRY
ncbi:MAG: translocation/assembly module TamB domain-containing protein [Elusimicrobiota bacterium]|nr:translocation/assembly module TamB domain-containing protein [Elusimicrobiota bacterium]